MSETPTSVVDELLSGNDLQVERDGFVAEVNQALSERLTLDKVTEAQRKQIVGAAFDACTNLENFENDPFLYTPAAWDIAAAVVESPTWKENKFSSQHLEAIKVFAAVVFEYIGRLPDDEALESKMRNIDEAYFSSSSDITAYVGGLADQIELMAYAEQYRNSRQIGRHGAGEIVYNGSFGGDISPMLRDGYESLTSIPARLAYIRTLSNLGDYAIGQGDYTIPFSRGVLGTLTAIKEDSSNHRLVRALADYEEYRLSQSYADEYMFFDDYEGDVDDAAIQVVLQKHRQQDVSIQNQLAEQYPDLPKYGRRSKVARDACAVIDGGIPDTLMTDDGHIVEIARSQSGLEMSSEQIALLGALYRPGIRETVEEELGIKLAGITFRSQVKLLEYMAHSSDEQYAALCSVLHESPDRELVAETFLATEFGDDYGDAIVAIAAHVSPEQSKQIFEVVNRSRERTRQFASWFHDYDPDFAAATERAMNERLTDALISLETLARQGELHVDVAPHRRIDGYQNDGRFMCAVGSIGEGIEIVEQLGVSMGLIHDVITAPDVNVSRVNENSEQFIIYRFASETFGSALLYIRPEGAKGYDRAHEYGNKKGVEASISFMVNPRHPHHIRSDKDPDAVSFRFDREGRLSDDSPFAEDRDPTKEKGTISIDISSGMGDARHMPVKIGRFIAAGNILRAQRTGGHESLHHNTNHFDQSRYGDASGFAKLAIYTAHMAEAMMRLQRHGSHASRYQNLPGVLSSVAGKSAA